MGKIDKVVITTLLTLVVGWVIYSIVGGIFQWNEDRYSREQERKKRMKTFFEFDGEIEKLLASDSVRIEYSRNSPKRTIRHFRTETTKKILSILLNDRIRVPSEKKKEAGAIYIFHEEKEVLCIGYFTDNTFNYNNYMFRFSENPLSKFKGEERNEKEETD